LVTQEHERDPGTQAILPRHIQINLLQLISDALRDGEKHITRSVKEGLDAWIAPMSVVSTLERSATVVLNFDSVDGLNIQNPIALHILMALAKCVASLLLTKARGRCICMKETSRRAFKAIPVISWSVCPNDCLLPRHIPSSEKNPTDGGAMKFCRVNHLLSLNAGFQLRERPLSLL
jgi:hypothetical protein